MKISDFDYDLPEERIARFPVEERDASKLLVWKNGGISETVFGDIGSFLPAGSLLVFNNTRVVRARLVMHRAGMPTADLNASRDVIANPVRLGARIEILCLEPSDPADYERAFAARGSCEWSCMVGNLKKWKSGPLEIPFIYGGDTHKLQAWRKGESGAEQRVGFTWDADLSFGELLELLGRVPIPPYLGRDSETIDNTRYQTVYARIEGSVAAPTAGLHFTPELIERLGASGVETDEVTLHVGAGTFLPVKAASALDHPMHTEHLEVTLATVEHLLHTMEHGRVIAVGTTSVRTLESLAALGWRIARSGGRNVSSTERRPSPMAGKASREGGNADGELKDAIGIGDPELDRPLGQFEPYDIPAHFDGRAALENLAAYMRAHGLEKIAASTRIMITPAGFKFRIVSGIVTNFHQPKSTLLLLIAAFTGGSEWHKIYDYALAHDFRFLSYGDSSLLI